MPVVLQVIQMLIAAEPSMVQAIHNLMTGTGTMSDLAVLKADSVAWQAIADHAAQQIAAAKGQPPIVQ